MSHNPNVISSTDPESVNVLRECISLQIKKSADYQNPNSPVKQADYYERSGIDSIMELIHTKKLRLESLLAAAKIGQGANFESIEDTFKDLINYSSFAVSYIRGKIPGQSHDVDMFNRPLPMKATSAPAEKPQNNFVGSGSTFDDKKVLDPIRHSMYPSDPTGLYDMSRIFCYKHNGLR